MKTKELSNKRRRLTLFLLTCLVMNISLYAQMAIGSADNPVAGAILDLNSGAAGGLVLSNAGIENPEKIPENFPGITLENAAAAKAGLKGAIVYNTGTKTCPGVHVWNGNYWERLASGVPRKSMGSPLSITSNPINLLGGDEIAFAVTTVAKTYTWYENNDKYLATTTTPFFSKIFPDGDHKVKVVADNCHFLEESEVFFAPGRLSPNFGSTAGGNYIYIYGDFPHAATGEYEQDGLVVHYDAINNQGLGDRSHSYDATVWKDLTETCDLPLIGTPASGDGWKSNAFKLSANTYFGTNSVPDSWPQGGDERTIEVTFRTPEPGWDKDADHHLFAYGSFAASEIFGIQYRYTNNMGMFYFIAGNTNNYWVYPASVPALYEDLKLNTVTSTYSTNVSSPNTRGLLNGEYIPPVSPGNSPLNTGSSSVTIGTYTISNPVLTAFGFEISSIRLYNRILTEEEIEYNAGLDQIRYLAPPTVSIDGNPCSEVVVLSPNFLICKVPPGTLGVKNVTINNTTTLNNAYEYVHDTDAFHIISIRPFVGHAGEELTLRGNKLDEIKEIRVGGAACIIDIPSQTSDFCKCTLPDNPNGEVDITIVTDTATYRFAKTFEYK
jgi:hypothetical protein